MLFFCVRRKEWSRSLCDEISGEPENCGLVAFLARGNIYGLLPRNSESDQRPEEASLIWRG